MSAAIRSVILAAFLLLPASSAKSSEFHFVLIFGSGSTSRRLTETHTFATFVRAVGEGTDPAGYALEAHTISWLPATGVIRPFAIHPEPGMNLDLPRTLDYVSRHGETIAMWGPYQIHSRMYERSLLQFRRLNSGDVTYRAGDSVLDPDICDCIHAVSDIDPEFGRGHYPLIRVGKVASGYIARQVEASESNDASQDHGWLIDRLGLDRCRIEVIRPRSRAMVWLRRNPLIRRRRCKSDDPLAKYAIPSLVHTR